MRRRIWSHSSAACASHVGIVITTPARAGASGVSPLPRVSSDRGAPAIVCIEYQRSGEFALAQPPCPAQQCVPCSSVLFWQAGPNHGCTHRHQHLLQWRRRGACCARRLPPSVVRSTTAHACLAPPGYRAAWPLSPTVPRGPPPTRIPPPVRYANALTSRPNATTAAPPPPPPFSLPSRWGQAGHRRDHIARICSASTAWVLRRACRGAVCLGIAVLGDPQQRAPGGTWHAINGPGSGDGPAPGAPDAVGVCRARPAPGGP